MFKFIVREVTAPKGVIFHWWLTNDRDEAEEKFLNHSRFLKLENSRLELFCVPTNLVIKFCTTENRTPRWDSTPPAKFRQLKTLEECKLSKDLEDELCQTFPFIQKVGNDNELPGTSGKTSQS